MLSKNQIPLSTNLASTQKLPAPTPNAGVSIDNEVPLTADREAGSPFKCYKVLSEIIWVLLRSFTVGWEINF